MKAGELPVGLEVISTQEAFFLLDLCQDHNPFSCTPMGREPPGLGGGIFFSFFSFLLLLVCFGVFGFFFWNQVLERKYILHIVNKLTTFSNFYSFLIDAFMVLFSLPDFNGFSVLLLCCFIYVFINTFLLTRTHMKKSSQAKQLLIQHSVLYIL